MRSTTLMALVLTAAALLAPTATAYDTMGVKWRSTPVAYRINSSGAPSGFAQACRNGANTWNNANIDFAFEYQGTTTRQRENSGDGVHAVYYLPTGGGMSNGTLAVTFTWSWSGRITHFDMAFNGRQSWTTNPSQNWSRTDIESVAVHEFGHALGLDHSQYSSSIMAPSIAPGTSKRTLRTDDVNGGLAIYGAGQSTPPPDPTPGTVVQTAPIGAISDPSPTFRWNAATGATSYELQILRSSGSVLASGTVTGTSVTLNGSLTVGESYSWKIRGLNSAGAGGWSTKSFSIVSNLPPEGVATLLTPTPGYYASSNRPTFTWSAVSGATRYQIWIQTSDGAQVLTNTFVNGTSYRPSSAIPAGIYYWWVRAYNGDLEGSWSSSAVFGIQ